MEDGEGDGESGAGSEESERSCTLGRGEIGDGVLGGEGDTSIAAVAMSTDGVPVNNE